jgi:hypothetical protein
MKKIMVICLLTFLFTVNVFAESYVPNDTVVPHNRMSSEEVIEIESLPTTEFVTGVRGGYYLDDSDVPVSIYHTYTRTSDGAIFAGNIWVYYIRHGLFNPEYQHRLYWQGFYEGTVHFQGYEQ